MGIKFIRFYQPIINNRFLSLSLSLQMPYFMTYSKSSLNRALVFLSIHQIFLIKELRIYFLNEFKNLNLKTNFQLKLNYKNNAIELKFLIQIKIAKSHLKQSNLQQIRPSRAKQVCCESKLSLHSAHRRQFKCHALSITCRQ